MLDIDAIVLTASKISDRTLPCSLAPMSIRDQGHIYALNMALNRGRVSGRSLIRDCAVIRGRGMLALVAITFVSARNAFKPQPTLRKLPIA